MTEAEAAPMTTQVPPLRAHWRLGTFRGVMYLAQLLMRNVIFSVAPLLSGLIVRAFFETLSADPAYRAGFNPYTLAALLVVVAAGRSLIIVFDITLQMVWIVSLHTLLRKNMLARIMSRPGARAVPYSPGEAVTRFRDDVNEAVAPLNQGPFVVGDVVFTLLAILIMLQINVVITVAVVAPFFVVIILAQVASGRVEHYRKAALAATGQVTGFIGEMFGALQAVRVANAETNVLHRFRSLNETRQRSAIRDRLFGEIVMSVFLNTSNLATGAILILASEAIQAGSFSVGDFALFVYYLNSFTRFTRNLGRLLILSRQAGVSLNRMQFLMQGTLPDQLTQHGPIHITGPLPEVPYIDPASEPPFEELVVTGLTYHYSDTGRGIEGINLCMRRGSFVVITGRIGSGKTTLLQTLLGLLPKEAGEIRWNGQIVSDPAAFFVPPRTAYTAQIPLLFSDSIRENLLLGLPAARTDLAAAVRMAALDRDIAALPEGLETRIGPKGVRLSGGQAQRTAAARMFAHPAAVYVFDDLSSALDAETENRLWARVIAVPGITCLVVSHRRTALRRADHILVLNEGRLEAEGKLGDLPKSSATMTKLWG